MNKKNVTSGIALFFISAALFLICSGCNGPLYPFYEGPNTGRGSGEEPVPGGPTVVDFCTISVTPPAYTIAPERTIETQQYTGTVEWNPPIPGGGTFAGSTVYTATIHLSPKEGYTFNGTNWAAFTVPGANTVTPNADAMTVTAQFSQTGTAAPTLVNMDTIEGITTPVRGEQPVSEIPGTDQFTGTVEWSPAPTGVVFAPATTYSAIIHLSPQPGYTFAGIPANFFSVDGAVSVTNGADSGDVTAVFPATSSAPVGVQEITGLEFPAAYATPDTTIDDAERFTGTVAWFNSDDTPLTGPFQIGQIYAAKITVEAKPGYTFTGMAANSFSVPGLDPGSVIFSVTNANTGVVTVTFPPVINPNFAARIGDTRYTTLNAAINAAPVGSPGTPTVITLLRSVTVPETGAPDGSLSISGKYIQLTVDSGADNAVALAEGKAFPLFTVSSGASLILGQDSGGGLLALDGAGAPAQSGRVGANVSGTLTMNQNVTISGFNNNGATNAGGVSVYGTFTMNGGTIRGNTTTLNGGGVYLNGTTARFTMNAGTTIAGNKAVGSGGGVYVSSGTFAMNGGTIFGTGHADANTAANGASLYVGSGSTATYGGDGTGAILSSGVVSTNATLPDFEASIPSTGKSYGSLTSAIIATTAGGILSNPTKIEVVKDITTSAAYEITANRNIQLVSTNGTPRTITASLPSTGGYSLFSVDLGASLTLGDGSTSLTLNGSAPSWVSLSPDYRGVKVLGGTLIMNKGVVIQNFHSTAANGGGVYMAGGAFTMNEGAVIQGNHGLNGGGVYMTGGTFTMNGAPDKTIIAGNKADGSGGGVYVSAGAFAMSGGTISGTGHANANTATSGVGASLYVAGGTANYTGNYTSYGTSIPTTNDTLPSSGNNEAKIGTQVYTTLTDAINMATSGSQSSPTKIEVLKDITASATYNVPSDRYIQLVNTDAANDRTITAGDGDFALFNVNSGATLKLGGGAGMLTLSGGGSTSAPYGCGVNTSGNFELLANATITGFYNTSGSGGGVYVNDGTFVMRGGTIADNSARTGGGVNVTRGTFTMTGGTIAGNSAETGGGVNVTEGTFTMTGGTIYGTGHANANTATSGVGASLANAAGTAQYGSILTGAAANVYTNIFSDDTGRGSTNGTLPNFDVQMDSIKYPTLTAAINAATGTEGDPTEITVLKNLDVSFPGYEIDGKHIQLVAVAGGVTIINGPVFSVTGGGSLTLDEGIELNGGGSAYTGANHRGVFLNTGKLVMNPGAKITNFHNSGVRDGGGVSVGDNSTFIMTGGEISGNKANGGSGGGVFVDDGGTFTMTGGTITDNEAYGAGGGVFVFATSNSNVVFTMQDGEISDNNAGYFGGGVGAYGARIAMSGGTISGNGSASIDLGGGINLTENAVFDMSGGTVFENTATNGGGIAVTNSTFRMSGGEIYGTGHSNANTVTGNGASLYLQTGTAEYAGSYTSFGTTFFTTSKTLPAGEVMFNGKSYATITAAIAAVPAGGTATIEVAKDFIVSAPADLNDPGCAIDNNKDITLVSAADAPPEGYTITAAAGGFSLFVANNARLTLGKKDGFKLIIKGGGGLENARRGVVAGRDGTVTMNENVVIEGFMCGGGNGGGGVGVLQGTFIMNGGTIKGNAAYNGGGVYVDRGTFTMYGGTIYGSEAGVPEADRNTVTTGSGASLYVIGGTAEYDDGSGILGFSGAGTGSIETTLVRSETSP